MRGGGRRYNCNTCLDALLLPCQKGVRAFVPVRNSGVGRAAVLVKGVTLARADENNEIAAQQAAAVLEMGTAMRAAVA